MLNKIYNAYRSRYGNLYRNRTRYVLDNLRAESSILILGAHEKFVRRVVETAGSHLRYGFVDKIPVDVPQPNFEYRESDLNESIPFDDNSFDCVVADQLLEHLVRPDTFLKEVRRVARPGGRLVLGSENLAAWHNIMALVLGFHPFSDHYSEHLRVGNPLSVHHLKPIERRYERHAKVPTVRAVEDLLGVYDFVVEDMRGFGHMLPGGHRLDPYHAFQFVFVARVSK